MRNRYRFKTRKEAEDAHQREETDARHLRWFVLALLDPMFNNPLQFRLPPNVDVTPFRCRSKDGKDLFTVYLFTFKHPNRPITHHLVVWNFGASVGTIGDSDYSLSWEVSTVETFLAEADANLRSLSPEYAAWDFMARRVCTSLKE